MTRSWATETRYTLRRNTASIMKGKVHMDKGRLSQCGHFVDKEEVNFSRFCADSFLDGLLRLTFHCSNKPNKSLTKLRNNDHYLFF